MGGGETMIYFNYRKTKLYKSIKTVKEATKIVETKTKQSDKIIALQWLFDTGTCWQLNAWYGRAVSQLYSVGELLQPIITHKDTYGNTVQGTSK